MSIVLREIENYDIKEASKYRFANNSSYTESYKEDKALQEGLVKLDGTHLNKSYIITAKIEALHCFPHATGNFTRYMPKACKESLSGWTEPYNIPVIMFHNDYDGQVIGRVKKASVEYSKASNTECLMIDAAIPNWRSQNDIRTGLLNTVSVGVSASDVRCSICNTQLAEGERCEHTRGYVYEGETCYWDVYEYTPKELSYVIVPSDKYARTVGYETEDYDYEYDSSSVTPADSSISLRNKEAENSDISLSIPIQESLNNKDISKKETERNSMNTEEKLTEQIKMNESLQTSIKALENDKAGLKEQLASITKEKVDLQESIKDLKDQISAKDAEITNEKSLRESQEKENEKLREEVKMSLVESLTALREKTNKPKIEKLEERSMESLRDSISDLKAEIELKTLQESQKETNDPTLHDSEQKFHEKDDNKAKEMKESQDDNSTGLVL